MKKTKYGRRMCHWVSLELIRVYISFGNIEISRQSEITFVKVFSTDLKKIFKIWRISQNP